jgi:hypothetical protein
VIAVGRGDCRSGLALKASVSTTFLGIDTVDCEPSRAALRDRRGRRARNRSLTVAAHLLMGCGVEGGGGAGAVLDVDVEAETEHTEMDVDVETEMKVETEPEMKMNAELETLSGCRQEPQLESR